jgi:hypothetical protein
MLQRCNRPPVEILIDCVDALPGELAWQFLRWRRLNQGIDIGTMPFSLGRYFGRPR